MSLFYDRTNNLTGVELLTGFSYQPEYGSSVNFTTKNNYFGFTDRQANIAPMGLNTVIGDYSLNLQLRESDAQKFICFYENQSGTGIFPISDNSNIYKTLSGTIGAVTSFDSMNNGKYAVALGFSVERNSSVLNWSGQSFVNYEFKRWETGALYENYDVVWFENDLDEPVNNFFYCTGAHVASLSNHPLSTGQKWTKNLFLDTNDQFSFQQKPLVSSNDFKDSFFQRINDQKNVHSFETVDFSFKNISDKKTKALLHFCESRLGFKRFEYSFPEIYNRPKVFFAPTWTHKWNYKDSNDLKITATEDPFAVVQSGKPNLYLIQDSSSSFSFSITGSERLFYETGNGKQLITGTNNTLVWPSAGSNVVKFWGKIAGFTGSGQSITKAQFGNVRDLTHLNLSNNRLGVLNLYDSPNLADLNCSGNRIGGFDLAGKVNLAVLDCQNNNASYLNISDCNSLTGLYAQGNQFQKVYVEGALRELVGNANLYGRANLSGSSGISESSISDVSNLSGKFWEVVYPYSPIIEEVTTLPPTTTPSPPSFYPSILRFSPNQSSVCSSSIFANVYLNDSVLVSSTAVNFRDEPIISTGQLDVFYISDGSGFSQATRFCCDKANLLYIGSCPVPPTTPPPTTPPPTTTLPPTTTPPPTTPPPTTTPVPP